jgi:hypothetical protein
MAVAATGGGLLVTAAGTVPAHAATQASGSHLVATITLKRAAPAASTSPSVILPCAVRSLAAAPTAGAAPADTCDSGIITCDVFAETPDQFFPAGIIFFESSVSCSENVTQIRLGEDVIHSTPIDPNNPLTDSVVVDGTNMAQVNNEAACQPGTYAVDALARIIPPSGYVVQGALHVTSDTVTLDCGGGSGGGGCAIPAPSASSQPATRSPKLITCQ